MHAAPGVGLANRMMFRNSFPIALLAALFVLLAGAAATASFVWVLLPKPGATASGVRIEGAAVPAARTPLAHAQELADRLENRTVRWRIGDGDGEEKTLRELGIHADVETTVRRAMAVGRRGSLAYRLDACWRARGGRVHVPLVWTMDPGPLMRLVREAKESQDRPGVAARYDFADDTVKPHEDGRYLDVHATLDELDRLVRAGGDTLDVVTTPVSPIVTASFLEKLDISQRVGHFETRFGYLGGQANRAHNIATAAARLDGVVLLPRQIISFNRIVGHRTLDNGFAKGWEIFRGEMVEGVGGGTCQTASTLHAAAYLGGLDIIERSPHSRPSGYIAMGLDATVVDGLVDLKIRNPFSFPIVLHSEVDKGRISFELRGQQRPVRVTFRGDVVDTRRYDRKVRVAHWLGEGRVIRKQRGIRGYTVRRVRAMRGRNGREWKEVTKDVYPPTREIYLVPPGTDPEEDLPPLPHEREESEGREEEPDEDGLEDSREPLTIEDGPAARRRAPRPPHRVVIDR